MFKIFKDNIKSIYQHYIFQYHKSMTALLKQLDIQKQLLLNPDLKEYINKAAEQILHEQEDTYKRFKKPVSDQQLQNHLILMGLPKVRNLQQSAKLEKVIVDLIRTKKNLTGLKEVEICNDGQKGNGTAYVIFQTAKQSKTAYNKLHQLKFTKTQTIECFTIKQFQQTFKISQTFTEPVLLNHQELISHNLKENFNDQFIFREEKDSKKENPSSNIHLRQFKHIDKSTFSPSKELKLEQNIHKMVYSPRGLYLAVFGPDGFWLYGGENFIQKGFYRHLGVLDVKFSQNERYMASYNGDQLSAKSKQNIIIWAVQQEIKLQSIRAQQQQNLDSVQFSSDSKKIAIMLSNQLLVYDIETVENFKSQLKKSEQELIAENKLYNYEYIKKIGWLKDNTTLVILCYDSNFKQNSHVSMTRILLLNTATKTETKWKAFGHHVKKGDIIISEKGQWVVITMKKFLKKNHWSTVVQVGNLLTRDLQIQTHQFSEDIVNISWDKYRGKFTLIYKISISIQEAGVIKTTTKNNASFWQIVTRHKQQKIQKIGHIDNTLCRAVAFPQNGPFFIMYNVDTADQKNANRGKITFGMFTKDSKKKEQLDIIKNIDIAYMEFFKIEQSGRYIILGTNKGYQIWNTIGELILKDSFDNQLRDIQWRPRYKYLLPTKKQEQLNSNWKQIIKKHDELNLKIVDLLKQQNERKRNLKKQQFLAFIKKKKQFSAKLIKVRQEIIGFNQNKVKTANYQVQIKIDVVQ